MVAYLKVGSQVRTYSDYLRAAREAEKEDSIELPQGTRTQTADGTPKPRTTSFFTPRKLKSNHPLLKKPAVCLEYLEEEDAGNGKDPESDDPGGIEGVTEEFMVHLARVVKDVQADEKCCYHCRSPEHFICNCLLIKTSRDKEQLREGGDGNNEGSLDPSNNNKCHEEPPDGGSQGVKTTMQTPFLNLDPFQRWYRIKNVAKVRINGESCMALLDNGAQTNTITPRYGSNHSLQVGPITNLMSAKVFCMRLGNTYTRLLVYIMIWVQIEGVQGYDKDQIALVILDLSNFAAQIPVILGTLTIG